MIRTAAVNLVIVIVGLIVAELVFGGWIGRRPLDDLNIPRSTDIHYDVQVPDGARWTGTYRRDEWGLRGNYRTPADIRLLTLGGSTTDQRLLSNPDTWQMAMARRLSARGLELAVGNAGVDGQSTIGHLRALDTWLTGVPGLAPRWVLVYAGINDAALGDTVRTADTMLPPDHWRRRVTDLSALYRLWRTVRGMVAAEFYSVSHELLPEPNADWSPAGPSAASPAAVEAYRERVARLAGRIRQWGAEPIFVTQPIRDLRYVDGVPQVRPAGTLPPIHDYNAALMETCARLSLTCLDLARRLPLGPGDFYDTLHYTPQGADKIGNWLGDALLPLLSSP